MGSAVADIEAEITAKRRIAERLFDYGSAWSGSRGRDSGASKNKKKNKNGSQNGSRMEDSLQQ
jgi:hypothetical protein